MSKNLSSRDKEIRAVFNRTLPFIDSALLSQYRLPKGDASEVEHGLCEWFKRFSRRPGSPESVESLRGHLLLMTCHAGHVYWTAKLGADAPEDERLNRTLTLGPREIAIELERRIEEKDKLRNRDTDQEKEKGPEQEEQNGP